MSEIKILAWNLLAKKVITRGHFLVETWKWRRCMWGATPVWPLTPRAPLYSWVLSLHDGWGREEVGLLTPLPKGHVWQADTGFKQELIAHWPPTTATARKSDKQAKMMTYTVHCKKFSICTNGNYFVRLYIKIRHFWAHYCEIST